MCLFISEELKNKFWFVRSHGPPEGGLERGRHRFYNMALLTEGGNVVDIGSINMALLTEGENVVDIGSINMALLTEGGNIVDALYEHGPPDGVAT